MHQGNLGSLVKSIKQKPQGYVSTAKASTSGECEVVTSVNERRGILAKKKLCFNCAAGQHRANACFSKSTCRKCNKRHHTSIRDAKDRDYKATAER